MKFLRAAGDKFDFELAPVEKDLLLHLLALYPLVPESHHQLTKDSQMPRRTENQRLLDESIKAQREANRKEIASWLVEPDRFIQRGDHWLVQVGRSDLEWLLQVMNDIRVGSWMALGSPGYAEAQPKPSDPKSMPHVLRLEVAGSFEMFFLGAVNGTLTPETDD